MMKRNKRPVGDHSDHPDTAILSWLSDQILNASRIEQLHIRHGKNFAHELDMNRAACLTTTKFPSSSNGTPMSLRNASAGLCSAMAEKSCPPSQHPPPSDTEASVMATLRLARALP